MIMIDILDDVVIEEYSDPISVENYLAESEVGDAPVDPASDEVLVVSDNEIDLNILIDELNELNENLERSIEEDDRIVRLFESTLGTDNISGNDILDDQTEYIVSVSENNIMTKAINDYTVEETFLFVISFCLIVYGVISLIKKGLPQWR